MLVNKNRTQLLVLSLSGKPPLLLAWDRLRHLRICCPTKIYRTNYKAKNYIYAAATLTAEYNNSLMSLDFISDLLHAG